MFLCEQEVMAEVVDDDEHDNDDLGHQVCKKPASEASADLFRDAMSSVLLSATILISMTDPRRSGGPPKMRDQKLVFGLNCSLEQNLKNWQS